MADIRRVIEIDVKTSAQAVAAMRDIARNTEALEKRFDSLASGAKKFGAVMAAEFSVSRIVGAIQHTLEQMDEFGKRAERIGIATEELSAFTHQAKLAGVNTEELDTALVKMNKALAGTDEEGSAASKALATLGVTATKPEQAFEEIAEAFSKMEAGAKKTALATDIFGKAGAKLIPMLNEGADGIKRAREEAERLGIVMSKEAAAAAQAFNDAMGTLQAGIDGARFQMVTGMLPALNQMAEAFKGTTETGERMKSFGEGLGTVINGATQVLLGFAGTVEVIGRGLAAFAGASEALFRGDFRQARTVMLEFRDDADKIFNDYATRIQKLREAPPLPTLRKGGGVDADEAARAAAAAAKAAKEAQRAAAEAAKAQQERLKTFIALMTEAERAAKEISDAVASFTGDTNIGQLDALNKRIERLNELERDGAIAADVAAEARAKLERNLLRLGDAHQQLQAELEDEADAEQAAIARREALNDLLYEGAISVEAYTRKIAALDKAQDELNGKTDTAKDSMLALGEAIQRSVEGWSGRATSAILDFAHGVEVNISSMVTNVLREFERMALQILIMDPLFKSFAATLKGLGWGAGGGTGGGIAEALGGAYDRGQRLAFASGGVVNRPTLFKFAGGTGMMGEAGPEAIMPLKRTASGKLGVEAQGSSGVTVNVINKANADVDVRQERDANGQRIITLTVERAMQDAIARGRFDSLMGATYGVSRKGR